MECLSQQKLAIAYLINRVIPGTYSLLASKDGFVTGQISEFVIEPSTEKQVDLLTLSVAIRSLIGNVTLENTNDYAGVLVTATNIADETLVYSAITNSKGDYTLAGMLAGEYRIVISSNGYRTETLPTISIVSSTVKTVDPVKIIINKGTISGTVKLEGKSSNEGVKVELMKGSVVYAESETDSFGNYSFYIPQGNYSGVRFSKTDFASSSVSKDIALFADNFVTLGDITLLASHNKVVGKVDVLTTDNEENVLISFDGINSIPSVTTNSTGDFAFEHIPVGKYVMRFVRNNCSDITIKVDVKASDKIDLGIVTITPNTATIKGSVVLKEGVSSEGVSVSIDMGGKTLKTTTDVSGRYELGGISVADEYIVTYSKNGWESNNLRITPKLEILEEREIEEVTLVDNIAPIISNVVVNEGSTFTDNPKLSLKLFAQDDGTGVDSYSIQIKKIVDEVESSIFPINYLWQSFEQNIEYDLAQLPNTVYTGNGDYKLIVTTKDRAGNISIALEKGITITNNATSLTGQLRGENLHLTKARSPYIIESNCTVGPEDTLVIDPGCEIRFAGNYSLYVAGKINAVGNEGDRILFTKNENYNGRWRTIAILGADAVINNVVEYEEGSIIKNCDFEYADIPLTLSCKLLVDNCNFNDSGSMIVTKDSVIINSYLNNGLYVDNSGQGITVVINNIIKDTLVYNYQNLVHLEYNTLENVEALISTGYYHEGWVFNNNKLIKSSLRFDQYLNTDNCALSNNSFSECEGIFIDYKLSSHDYNVVDYSHNYWGAARTEEIIAKGSFSDLTFIHDWFDDSSQPRVNYDNWLEEEPAIVGYQGDSFDWNLLK